jgi:ketosteroid isomerase-like protein
MPTLGCVRFRELANSEHPMKHLLIVSLALLSYLSWGQAPIPTSPPAVQAGPDAASAELVTSTKAWTDAMNAKDHAKLEALMAPEFALYRWNGELAAPRPDWLDFLYTTEIKEYSVRDISARAYGEFGVVTLVCTWAGVHDGRPFDLNSIIVDTWHRTNGKWQVVARNSCTPTPASADTPGPCPRYSYSR